MTAEICNFDIKKLKFSVDDCKLSPLSRSKVAYPYYDDGKTNFEFIRSETDNEISLQKGGNRVD